MAAIINDEKRVLIDLSKPVQKLLPDEVVCVEITPSERNDTSVRDVAIVSAENIRQRVKLRSFVEFIVFPDKHLDNDLFVRPQSLICCCRALRGSDETSSELFCTNSITTHEKWSGGC